MSKPFKIEVLLTCVTGRMFCTIQELQDMLEYITNSGIMTHELNTARKEVKPYLIRSLPFLECKHMNKLTDRLIELLVYKENSISPVYNNSSEMLIKGYFKSEICAMYRDEYYLLPMMEPVEPNNQDCSTCVIYQNKNETVEDIIIENGGDLESVIDSYIHCLRVNCPMDKIRTKEQNKIKQFSMV